MIIMLFLRVRERFDGRDCAYVLAVFEKDCACNDTTHDPGQMAVLNQTVDQAYGIGNSMLASLYDK